MIALLTSRRSAPLHVWPVFEPGVALTIGRYKTVSKVFRISAVLNFKFSLFAFLPEGNHPMGHWHILTTPKIPKMLLFIDPHFVTPNAVEVLRLASWTKDHAMTSTIKLQNSFYRVWCGLLLAQRRISRPARRRAAGGRRRAKA